MKIAKKNNLPDDIIFLDHEPFSRKFIRSISIEEDDYDFETNDSEDITSILNWTRWYKRLGINKPQVVVKMQDLISNWESHNQEEKDILLNFVVDINPISVCLTTEQIADLQDKVWVGFITYEIGTPNVKKEFDGVNWI